MNGDGCYSQRTIAGVFLTRLVDVLALAFGAALALVALVAEAFFGAALVAVLGLASVFLGRPAVLVPAGFVALVAFCEEKEKEVSWDSERKVEGGEIDVPWRRVSFPWWRWRVLRRVPSWPASRCRRDLWGC